MPEKTAHQKWGQVRYGQSIDRFGSGMSHERKQHDHRIPIAALGVARQIAFGDQMFEQKAAYPRSDQGDVTHGTSPVGHSERSADLPRAEAQASWPSNTGWSSGPRVPGTSPVVGAGALR